jgi:membrane protein insertase, YidC/Oxa1 family, C-terminal domain
MGFFTVLYNLIIQPLSLLLDFLFACILRYTDNEGIAIIALSLAINILIFPLYKRADAMQEEERLRSQKLQSGVSHIKKAFKGDERFMMLQTYYRQNNYKPYYALKGSLSLLLEIPFFIAAYNYLSGLGRLRGASFGPIADLCLPDRLIHIAGYSLNLLPLLMTAINIVSSIIYTKGMPMKARVQTFGMAVIFLVFLYDSPSGLVFYWTLNNIFSLIKNIFYRIRHPKLVLSIISAAVSAAALPYVLFVKHFDTAHKQTFAVMVLLLMLIPLAWHFIFKNHKPLLSVPKASKTDNAIFYVSCVFMTILIGVLIPSAVIHASPDEFVEIGSLSSPLRYVFHSFTLAAGTFLVWVNVFYHLSTSSSRKIISTGSAVVAASSLVNYMFFGNNYGNMSSTFIYDNLPVNTTLQIAGNIALSVAIAVCITLIGKKHPTVIRSVCAAGCATVAVMSCVNIFQIHSSYTSLKNRLSSDVLTKSDDNSEKMNTARLTLDKNGKNVVVIMLDRGINYYFPFIMQEKPGLKEQFAGFTYYPNTISYGNCTSVGSPGLFGGYEYIPEESNRRSDQLLVDKQNEALKVMPVLFSSNGYKTTVCDPTYAGYRWIPDLSIYDDYPEISRYITNGSFISAENLKKTVKTTENVRNRNLFAYSIFRSSPLLLHQTLYNLGSYNQANLDYDSSEQMIRNTYQAIGDGLVGKNLLFYEAYDALRNYPNITEVRESGQGTFTMISNDTTHNPMMLQEPEYEPAGAVDNRSYESEHSVRYSLSGEALTINDSQQMIHYQCNMAAMIQLGQWFDYLRENDVYDNTKIIIVSDHGAYLSFPGMEFDADNTAKYNVFNDVNLYKSLLLVKDFDSHELTEDPAFMTNADTPAIAFSGLIDNPVNPFTGKAINSDYKNKPEQHIVFKEEWVPDAADNAFRDTVWIRLKGNDTKDTGSWRVIGRKLP